MVTDNADNVTRFFSEVKKKLRGRTGVFLTIADRAKRDLPEFIIRISENSQNHLTPKIGCVVIFRVGKVR